jgi:hypothetical protein
MPILSGAAFQADVHSLPKNIYLRLETLPQAEVVRTDSEPPIWLLVKVQTATYLHNPSIVDADLAVVNGFAQLNIKHDVVFKQALFQFGQALVHHGEIGFVVIAGL